MKQYNPTEAGNVLAMWAYLADAVFELDEDALATVKKIDDA